MIARIQVRRDTYANWTSNNPTLANGEIGYDETNEKFKVGDNTTAWNDLPYELGQWKSDASGNLSYGNPVSGTEGNVTVHNNLIVEGDFTVNGTTTTVNTQHVLIEDNMIVLNTNLTDDSSAPPDTLQSGIEVNLSGSNRKLYWDQATSKWILDADVNVLGDIYSNGTALWRLNSNDIYFTGGNVGIGTNSPATLLHLKDNTPANENTCLRLENDAQVWDLCNRGGDSDKFKLFDVTADNSPFIVEKASPDNCLYIKSNGNVGIGTSSPSKNLHILETGTNAATIRLGNTDTLVSTDQVIGSIEFETADSTIGSTGLLGKIDVLCQDETPDSAMRFFTTLNDTGTKDFSERMRISNIGNVGIGTTSPQARLSVTRGDDSIELDHISSPDTNRILSYDRTANAELPLKLRGSILTFDTAATERMRIDGNGKVGIGTSSPSAPLHVRSDDDAILRLQSNDSETGSAYLEILDSASASKGFLGYGSTADDNLSIWNREASNIRFATGNAEKMRLTSGGSLGIGTTSPSYELEVSGKIHASGGIHILDRTSDGDITPNNWPAKAISTFLTDDIAGSTYTWDSGITVRGYVDGGTPLQSYRVWQLFSNSSADLDISGDSATADDLYFRSGTGGAWGTKQKVWTDANLPASSMGQWTTSGSNIHYTTGNVGVGTNSPGAKIDIGIGASNALGLRVTSTNDAAVTGDHISAAALRGDTDAYNLLNLTNSVGTKLIVQGDGKVGIGTTSPSYPLHVKSSSNASIGMETTNQNWRLLNNSGDSDKFMIRDETSGTNRLSITTDGKVGIGTSSPTANLHVRDATASPSYPQTVASFGNTSNNASLNIVSASNTEWGLQSVNSRDITFSNLVTSGPTTTRLMTIKNDGKVGINNTSPSEKLDVVGNITATGTITSSSDITLKENIELISDPIEKVKEISGYTFNKKGEDLRLVGLIAQEVEKVLPEAVAENNEGLKSVAYGNLVALLVECVKKQDERIDQLEKTIEKLK